MHKYIHFFIDNAKALTGLRKRCLDSWKKHMPEEYEIKIWCLDDIKKIDDDIAKEVFKLENYNIKKAYIEVYVMYKYGGIFVDQNIELTKNITDLMNKSSSFLALDEKRAISSSVWYENKPKNPFATNVYNTFKSNFEEGKYNSFFLELPLIYRQILEDFEPSCDKTVRLKNDIIIYSSDYFYPYSYDGNGKNKTKNTRAYNYFNYDFITKKGKVKNLFYSLLGYNLSKRIFSLGRLLKSIVRLTMLPIVNYRNIRKKNTNKHQALFNTTLEKLDQYKNKTYVAFHNPEWTGVSNATIELFPNSVPCGELINSREVKLVAKTIQKNNIKEVIFSGFCIGWKQLAMKLHKQNIVVKTYFHGSHSQYTDDYGWKMNKQIYLLEKNKIVSEMAFCKESLINFYKDKGCNATFLRNLVNIDYKIRKHKKNNNEYRVGVYAVQATQWRKNVFTSLASIYYIKQMLKDENIVVDVVPRSPSVDSFCHILDLNLEGTNKAIPREELLQRMHNCDMTLYVTFSECAPMVPLESFYVGTPCITGNNHHYFKDTELEEYVVVSNENNPMEIAEKIIKCTKNKDKVFKLYDCFSKSNLHEGKELVNKYLRVGATKNE